MKIEVGKTYINREGKRVTIVENDGDEIYPFVGDNGGDYTSKGEYWTEESREDLIREAPPVNPHPLAEEIKKWADDPDGWQWQIHDAHGNWTNVSVQEALKPGNQMAYRLIHRHSLIRSDCLPEWCEVERKEDGSYLLKDLHGGQYRCVGTHSCADSWLYSILRHIDPEADNG